MQGRKHLTPKLRFTALLVLLTIQATSVDSSPADVSELTSGGSGTQLKNGNSPRRIGWPINMAPDHESRSKQRPSRLTGNRKERPVSKTSSEEAVPIGTDDSLHSLVSMALGSHKGYMETLKRGILESIEEDISDTLRDSSGVLFHHRETGKYGSTNGGVGWHQMNRRSPIGVVQRSLVSIGNLTVNNSNISLARHVRQTDGNISLI